MVAADMISRQSQVLRYVAGLLDIDIFSDDEKTGFSPRFLDLCTRTRDSVTAWASEHMSPPPPPEPQQDPTITADDVRELLAFLGPEIVIEQLDHGNQHLWLTCPRHYDTKIALVMDFTDPLRFTPTSLTPAEINAIYVTRAFELRDYGLKPCSSDTTVSTFEPPSRRQRRKN